MKHRINAKIDSLMDLLTCYEVDKIIKIANAKNSGWFVCTIENMKRPRSTGEKSQGNHFNGHIQAICKDTGNDFDDVKKYVKHKAVSRGYPMLKNPDMFGNIRGISEADASVEECGLLIEQVHQLASELGIILEEV